MSTPARSLVAPMLLADAGLHVVAAKQIHANRGRPRDLVAMLVAAATYTALAVGIARKARSAVLLARILPPSGAAVLALTWRTNAASAAIKTAITGFDAAIVAAGRHDS